MWHGCAHIAGLYPNRSIPMDFLTYGANLVKTIGFDTIKLELSITYSTIKYINQSFTGSPTTLTQLAQEPAFADVFSDSDFNRYVLTCFSLAHSIDNPWSGQWTKAIGDTLETEMYDLCVHLLSTYSGKEFIIQNWEGDWQLLNSFNPNDGIPRNRLYAYRDYHRRRQRALTRARTNTVSTSTIYYMMECNRVLDGWGERVHRSVIENINPDIVSLSCYEAVEGWLQGLSQAAFEADIATKLARIVARVRLVSNAPIVLGEYGWPIDMPYFVSLGYDVGALWLATINAAISLGIVGQIPWQILDNEEQSPGVPRGFGMYTRNGNSAIVGPLSASGTFFNNYL